MRDIVGCVAVWLLCAGLLVMADHLAAPPAVPCWVLADGYPELVKPMDRCLR